MLKYTHASTEAKIENLLLEMKRAWDNGLICRFEPDCRFALDVQEVLRCISQVRETQ